MGMAIDPGAFRAAMARFPGAVTIITARHGSERRGITATAVCSVTADPPIVWLCVLLAIPGFAGWGAAPFVHRLFFRRKSERLAPLMDLKYDELYSVCEKGNRLMNS